ncbi:Rix1 complex component [Aspergillus cavernicola]|uniref:Pre-rRNA-processing protein n=1 Tax=Aspergillus cavernicola TaxID=176166 RepID=A0ABR4IIZ0_9EURO
MGASQKRKKEKQLDFKKPKLKVGKAKAKPENFTDTSFKSKSIILNQQSLKLTAPSPSTQFTHTISLLSSKSDPQRRDALAHLTTTISSAPTHAPLTTPVSAMLPSLLPLLLDPTAAVRTNLLKLFRVLPESDIQDHVAQLLPYLRAGMTHLAPDVRVSAVEVLSWLVGVAGGEVVACAGGWVKTLNCFLSVLGWHVEGGSKWTSVSTSSTSTSSSTTASSSAGGARGSFGKAGSKGRPQVKVLTVLAEFLQAGIGSVSESEAEAIESESGGGGGGSFPIMQLPAQMIPQTAAPYIHLNLFGKPRDEEGEMYETREDRYRVFEGRFLGAVEKGVEGARQEGGEVGRASAGVRRVLIEAKT